MPSLRWLMIILQSFEKGEFTLGVFIDLSKAFDSVNHSILLKKLTNYGITGIYNTLFESLQSYYLFI